MSEDVIEKREKMYTDFINEIKSEEYPSILFRKIARFINDGIREKKLTIYEGFLLNQESLRFLERSLFEPAWNKNPGVYDIMHFLNQKLL